MVVRVLGEVGESEFKEEGHSDEFGEDTSDYPEVCSS